MRDEAKGQAIKPSQAKLFTNTKTHATMPRIGAPGTNMKVRVDGDDVKVYPER